MPCVLLKKKNPNIYNRDRDIIVIWVIKQMDVKIAHQNHNPYLNIHSEHLKKKISMFKYLSEFHFIF